MTRPRVIVLRGQQANPWELRAWQPLLSEFDVVCPATESNVYALDALGVPTVRTQAASDLLPRGPVRALAARAPVNRYLDAASLLAGADIVHGAELGFWFTAQAASLKRKLGFRLVVTVWETIAFRRAYRHALGRRHRAAVLGAADLFLAASQRARDALLLEGVEPERIRVSPPGVDVARFSQRRSEGAPLVLSVGRLVWEKGHQDVLRAVAALHRGLVAPPPGGAPRALIVGSGPEERRLRAYARDLGIGDAVDFRRAIPYDEMPGVYAQARCLVLASLPTPSWEEQFGMVLAEALANGLPILTTTSGAIPEVAGPRAHYVAPGDWMALARALAEGPLAAGAGERVRYEPERVDAFSVDAASARLRDAYLHVLAGSGV